MKVLWLDDTANDPEQRALLLDEWNLDDESVLSVTRLEEALRVLNAADIRLVILDLIWEGEPEHISAKPTGLHYLEELRKAYPGLLIATRSHVTKADVLASYIQTFVEHRVVDHFLVDDRSRQASFRRNLVLQRAEDGQREVGLSAFLGERWGVVMFADISGFTTMTEKLWGANQSKLLGTLKEFYARAGEVVNGRGGVIDKLVGDEVMAIFPASNSNDRSKAAKSAVDAAADIRNRFLTIERDFKSELIGVDDDIGDVKWQLKIGLEGGSLMIHRELLPHGEPEYCTIGFAVNVAARIKGLSGPYTITLGPTIQPLLPQATIYATDPIPGPTLLTGFGRKLQLYTLHEELVTRPPKPISITPKPPSKRG